MKTRALLCLLALAAALAGCSSKGDSADANRPAQSPAAAPKPYLPPEEVHKAVAAESTPCIVQSPEARVDWSDGRIVAGATAKAPSAAPQERIKAQRAAEQAAIRNALLAANGVAVDARGTYGDIRNGVVDVEGAVTAREVLSNKWDAASLTATATVAVPMYGLAGVVRLDGVPVEKPAKRRTLQVHDPVKEEADLIVIRVRGDNSVGTSPRLVDEQGQVVFDVSDVPSDQLAARHFAVYVEARTSPNAATGPASKPAALSRRINLSGSFGGEKGDICLSEEALAELSRHPDWAELLKAGRLVIVLIEPYYDLGPRRPPEQDSGTGAK